MKFRVLDLFSGIGGFSLGLERTGGFETVAFCEIEPFPRRVLNKHWPTIPVYDDVRTLTAERLAADGVGVDVICGGFPCQDISLAGKGAGLDGERSGLWSEIARLTCELRPRYLIVENVSALLGRGLDRVLGDLAEIGFDAEWHCIPASALGAPHRRDRFWLVAYAQCSGRDGIHEREQPRHLASNFGGRSEDGSDWAAAEDYSGRVQGQGAQGCVQDVAAADRSGLEERQGQDATGEGPFRWPILERSRVWLAEPDVGRVANGVPKRVDRLRALGNAVVPQIPEMIGRAILAAENRIPLMEAAE